MTDETKSPQEAQAAGSECSAGLGEDEELVECLWCGGSTPLQTAVGACCWEEWKQEIGDLSMMVRKLASSLRKAAPNNDLPDRAIDYLKRKNLQGSILRDA